MREFIRKAFPIFVLCLQVFVFPAFAQDIVKGKNSKDLSVAETVDEAIEQEIEEEFPLTDKFYSSEYIRSWIGAIATKPLAIAYDNYDFRTEYIKRYFTEEGYKRYLYELDKSGLGETIVKEKMVVFTNNRGRAEILEEGVKDGRYRWLIEVPVSFIFTKLPDTYTMDSDLLIEVVRDNSLNIERAVAINNWIAVPLGGM